MGSKRQVAVLGTGRFGRAVAQELTRLGHDVLAVDSDEESLEEISSEVTHAARADITDGKALRDLGIGEFDTVIVAVSSDLEVSILATAHLKRLGVKRILAKAGNELHGAILQEVGATRVVYPERETGYRVAHSFAAPAVQAYLDVGPGYGVARARAVEAWVGKSLAALDLRASCGVIALLLVRGGDVIVGPPDSEVLRPGDELILAGLDEDLERLPGEAIPDR